MLQTPRDNLIKPWNAEECGHAGGGVYYLLVSRKQDHSTYPGAAFKKCAHVSLGACDFSHWAWEACCLRAPYFLASSWRHPPGQLFFLQWEWPASPSLACYSSLPLGSPQFCLLAMEKRGFFTPPSCSPPPKWPPHPIMFCWPESCMVIQGVKELAGRGEAGRKLSGAGPLSRAHQQFPFPASTFILCCSLPLILLFPVSSVPWNYIIFLLESVPVLLAKRNCDSFREKPCSNISSDCWWPIHDLTWEAHHHAGLCVPVWVSTHVGLPFGHGRVPLCFIPSWSPKWCLLGWWNRQLQLGHLDSDHFYSPVDDLGYSLYSRDSSPYIPAFTF